ncbi:lipopolysaccharide biosynthesis protein [Pseudoalteromonas sp. RB2-MNA-CIBAN-0110]|uniref:lipopolysaccharide biosynthesis protein n=1 Tax=Pseudoalteromonas sp. RB2-MNA-CIBAN-0110 TaxID=3140439 RepID=UPI0033280E54
MPKGKFFRYAIGGVVTPILGLITIPLLSWVFSPSQLGEMNLFLVIVTGITLVFSFGLDQGLIREYERSKALPLVMEILFYISLVFIITYFILFSIENETLLKNKIFTENILFEVFLTAFLLLLIRFNMVVMRMEEYALAFSLTQIVRKLSILITLSVSFYLYKNNLFESLINVINLQLYSALITTIFSFFVLFPFFKSFKYSRSKKFKKCFSFGWPLTFSGLLFWGLTSLDRFYISYFTSMSDLGVYSLAVSFAAIIIIVQTIFSTIWIPIIYKWYEQKSASFLYSYTEKLVVLILIFIYFLILLFSPLIKFFIPESYYDSIVMLSFVSLYPLFYTITEVSGIGINLSKKTKLMIPIMISTTIINLSSLAWFVPVYGALGAAASLAVTFYFYFLIKSILSNRFTPENIKTGLKTYVLCTLILIISFFNVFISYYFSLLLMFLLLIYVLYDFFTMPNLKEFYYEWTKEI